MRASIVTLVAAIVLGLIAAVGVFVYTASAEDRVLADQRATKVYVSTELIAVGTSASEALTSGALEETQVPAATAPAGVMTSPSGFALGDIAPGQIVLQAAFADQMPVREPIVIDSDELALTLELGDPQRVGSFLRPGSKIAIFNTVEEPERQTRLLLFGVEVLAVGSATMTESENDQVEEAQTALVTVAVSPQNAERLVHATQTGSLYLALLSNAAEPAFTVGVTDTSLYEQEQS